MQIRLTTEKFGLSIPGCPRVHAKVSLSKVLNPKVALRCVVKCAYGWVNEACCIKHFARSSKNQFVYHYLVLVCC